MTIFQVRCLLFVLLRDFEREFYDFFFVHFDKFVVSSGAVH